MKKKKKKKDQQWNGEHYKIKVVFFQNHLKLHITCFMLFTRSVLVFSFWLNDKVSTMLLICISCVGYHSEVYHSHVSKGIWFHGVSILWMVLLTGAETAFSTCFGDWEACNARKKLTFIEVIKVLRYWMVGIFKWNTYTSDVEFYLGPGTPYTFITGFNVSSICVITFFPSLKNELWTRRWFSRKYHFYGGCIFLPF